MSTPYNRTVPPVDADVSRPVTSTAFSFRRMSWGAVFAGMVIAVVVQLMLSLLGTGIGMSTIDPLRYGATPDASSFGIGAAIWWAITSVIALYAGGWVAGHLAGSPEKTDGMLHGLLAWGLATILTVYLLASAIGAVARGGASVVGTAASVTATGVGAAAGPIADAAKSQLAQSGISVDDLKAQAKELLAQTGIPGLQPSAMAGQASAAASQMTNAAASAGSTGNAAGEDLQSALQKIIASGKETVDKVDRDALVNVVMARSNVSRTEAEQRVDGWVKSYEKARAEFAQKKAQAEQKAKEAADAAAKATSQASFGGFVALLLGAIAAALGGMSARRRDVIVGDTRRPAY